MQKIKEIENKKYDKIYDFQTNFEFYVYFDKIQFSYLDYSINNL